MWSQAYEIVGDGISCAKVCHLEVDAAHSWVDWTLPVSKLMLEIWAKCDAGSVYTLVTSLNRVLSCHRCSAGDFEVFARRFRRYTTVQRSQLRVTGARLMAGMGFSIVLIQLMARWSFEAVLRYVAEAPL